MKTTSLLLLALLVACSDRTPRAATVAPLARVEHVDGVDVVVLAPSAVERLGVTTAQVSDRRLNRVRSFAGDLVVPPGRAVTVGAPLAAVVRGPLPRAGARVAAGAALLTIEPLLTPDARANLAASLADAEGAARSNAKLRDAAELALARARQMLAGGVGSERAVEQAQAARDSAVAVADASAQRRDLLAAATAGTGAPLPVVAPFAGLVRQVAVAPGVPVVAGAPLCELVDLGELWLRVPVYVGEVERLDLAAALEVAGALARPVDAPPSADPVARTVDLYYAIEADDVALRPGQTVFADVPVRDDDARLTVPASALHRDAHGGEWVYVELAAGRYARRGVQQLFLVDGLAAVVGDLRPGEPVVSVGVPELWGVESGHAR